MVLLDGVYVRHSSSFRPAAAANARMLLGFASTLGGFYGAIVGTIDTPRANPDLRRA